MTAIVMVTTVGDEEQGNTLARELIARRQAACVNMIRGVKSFYRWQGKICHDSEFLLIIKTMSHEYAAVSETIHELHTYDVPEILAFDIGRGDERFLDWVSHCVDKDAPFEDDDEDEEFD